MMSISKIERIKYFDYLLSSVNNCDICNRMCTRKKVLSINNGNLYSKVIFIAEVPGRLGAECTGIPLYGDKTGENFEMLLGNIGWKRDDVNMNNTLLDMVVAIITEIKTISFFKLTKLLYLIDYYHYKDFGNSMSDVIYLRMQDGPWIPTLKNIINEYKDKLFLMTYDKRKPILLHKSYNYISGLNNDQKQYIHNLLVKYMDCSDVTIKIMTYRTEPMQYILNQEGTGRNMSRIPVLFKDASVLEIDKKLRNNIVQGELFDKQ